MLKEKLNFAKNYQLVWGVLRVLYWKGVWASEGPESPELPQ